jgi:hypothetical protein
MIISNILQIIIIFLAILTAASILTYWFTIIITIAYYRAKFTIKKKLKTESKIYI